MVLRSILEAGTLPSTGATYGSPQRVQVLQYLITNPNLAIPHGRILQAVWGPDYGDEVEYLHVVINHLRKKIEPDPAKPQFILTEPWVGYRFQLSGRKP